jgi:ATP-binding cassette subfamily C protein
LLKEIKMMSNNVRAVIKKNKFWIYTGTLTKLMPKKFFVALLLMVLISLTEGLGLLLLVPLLQLVGLDVQQGSLGQITLLISELFTIIGIQMNLLSVLVIYVLITSISALLYRFQTIRSYEIQYKFAAHMRKRLYSSITNSNWLFFTKYRASDFAHALTNEIERIGFGTSQFLSFLSSIMVLMVYIIFAFKLTGILTGIIFFVGLAFLLLLRRNAELSRSSGEEITTSTRDLYSSIMQHLDGMKTIKSFSMQQENIGLFSSQTNVVAQKYMDTISSYANVKLLFDVGTVVVLAIMVMVLIQVVKIPTATLILLIYLFFRMIPLFSVIQSSYQYILNMLPAFINVTNLEKRCWDAVEPNESKDEKVELNKVISFREVSFSYQSGEHFAIRGLNLQIPAGKTTAIIGPSGAGKSTVTDLLMGFIKPEKGRIEVDGVSVSNSPGSWRNIIGYVPQDTFLFNESLRFNLLFSKPDADENELKDALKLAAASEFVYKLPNGLDTVIGDRGVRLSGGERQRLALARALLRKPCLLILDEATSNLDSENEKRILKAIGDLHGEITILVIAHRLSTIQNSDYIHLMVDGRILESGTWYELLKSGKGKFWELCQAQGLIK